MCDLTLTDIIVFVLSLICTYILSDVLANIMVRNIERAKIQKLIKESRFLELSRIFDLETIQD